MTIEKKIKLYSTIGSRATFGLHATEIIKNEKYKDIFFLSADTSTSAGLDKLRKFYPKNYVEIGIAEQNMIGVATGMASQGAKVVTTTFSPFQTLRCCEQIKVNLGYMKEKITMVGLASGLVLGNLGYTHCSIEDIGVLRSIPNITILSPCDSFEVTKCLDAALEHDQSVYIRLTGGSNCPIVNKSDYDFKIGKNIELLNGEDIALIATGSMVHTSCQVSEKLKEKNINASVLNVHTLKPIDEKFLTKYLKKYKTIATLEEHNIIGGLGSVVSEVISKNSLNIRQLFFGVSDEYKKSGSYYYLKKEYGLLEDQIINKLINHLYG